MKLGSGTPSVDFNGTKYTAIEGSAADNNISIDNVLGRGKFDPLSSPGIALTSQQAKELGVKVGDKVSVRDNQTGKVTTATFYDSAGSKRPGDEKLKHFEVSPRLADELGIKYRNKAGKVVDAVTNTENLTGRFSIEKFNGAQAGSGFDPAPPPSISKPAPTANEVSSFNNRYSAGPSLEDVKAGKAELKIGDKGEAVKELQRKLGVKADGMFGPITQRALTQAQRNASISDTPGHAGKKTFAALSKGTMRAPGEDTFAKAKPLTTGAEPPPPVTSTSVAGVNTNDPTLQKLANGKLSNGKTGYCVKTTLANMGRLGVKHPAATGEDVGNNPRGGMVQLGKMGWKSIALPGAQPTTIKSPYGTMQAQVIPASEYAKLAKEGKIPSGAVVFQTRHDSWNSTSKDSHGFDMAIVRDGGKHVFNFAQSRGPLVYRDTRSVVVMVPGSAVN